MSQYFCTKCNKPAVLIQKVYKDVMETRQWDGDIYELTDSNFDDQFVKTVCFDCGTELNEEVKNGDGLTSNPGETIKEADSLG